MLISLDGRHIKYDLLGADDRPVVCLAHALSADSGIWAEQVGPLLEAGWRVLRLDMRGHGGSDAGCAGGYTMSELASDVIAVLDELRIDRVHFAGLSIGGMIGQMLALDHSERLLSAMLCDTAPANIPGGKATWDGRFAAMAYAGSVEPLADATMDRWLTEDFRQANPGRWEQVRSTVACTTVDGYIGGGTAILHFDVRDRLPEITVPTMVVWGDEDTGTPPDGNQYIADHVPGARHHVFKGARHVPMVEFPDAFARVMLDWLSGQRQSTGRYSHAEPALFVDADGQD